MRRRLRIRTESTASAPPPRARPTRRQRRTLSRSRSAGPATRINSHRHAYERSHSCPEYHNQTNTYKITDNMTDHIFHVNLSRVTKIPNVPYLPHKDHMNTHYAPQTNSKKTQPHLRGKVLPLQSRPSLRYFERPITIETDNYVPSRPRKHKRRLPDVDHYLHKLHVKSLPNIPSIKLGNNKTSGYSKMIEDEDCKYHGYDSDGSVAETTIHVSLEKQSSLDTNTSNLNNNDGVSSPKISFDDLNKITTCNSRKKTLSLDVKSSYDNICLNKTQSLDMSQSSNRYHPDKIICKAQDDFSEKIKVNDLKPNDETFNKRRHSDSAVLLKNSPSQSVNCPDEITDIFKKMSIGSVKSDLLRNEEDIKPNNYKRAGNVVSINETPTFQEYRSPNSLSPPPSLDYSFKKPLPSIIKKARPRSYSLSSKADHLDDDFSTIANFMCIALSPPNLGSPHRALTPVAPHTPLDDSSCNADAETPDSFASNEPNPSQHAFENCYRRNPNQKNINSTKSTEENQRGKSTSRRDSKRSNEYGGNGRNNNQQQPLERRESRRGQFTRSLSNADVPPDEKAGRYTFGVTHIAVYLLSIPFRLRDIINYYAKMVA